MARAVKQRKRSRKSPAKKAGKSTWPWVLVMLLTAGGILAYDHRDQIMPSVATASILPSLAREKPLRRVEDVQARPKTVALPTPGTRPLVDTLVGNGYKAHFAYCGTTGLTNCVVDGDTFWHQGVKIHLADVDAPQTERAKCDGERRRGFDAAVRLRDLLNAGPFELRKYGDGDESDGGKLRVVARGGRSLGVTLVSEGLAKKPAAKPQPWC